MAMKIVQVGRKPEFFPQHTTSNKMLLLLEDVVPSKGVIVSWQYYRREPLVPAIASVWRKLDGEGSYKLVGQNDLPAGVMDMHVVPVNEDERISVEPGDILGIFYSHYSISGSIACSAADREDCDNRKMFDVVELEVFEEDLDVGDVVNVTKLPHTARRMAVALQANILIPEKDRVIC